MSRNTEKAGGGGVRGSGLLHVSSTESARGHAWGLQCAVPAAIPQYASWEGNQTDCRPVRCGALHLCILQEGLGTRRGAGSTHLGSGFQHHRWLSRAPKGWCATCTKTSRASDCLPRPRAPVTAQTLQVPRAPRPHPPIYRPESHSTPSIMGSKYRNTGFKGKKCEESG